MLFFTKRVQLQLYSFSIVLTAFMTSFNSFISVIRTSIFTFMIYSLSFSIYKNKLEL
nr:MAG TPA: hypothetical protein [Caudoviricetes sp.]